MFQGALHHTDLAAKEHREWAAFALAAVVLGALAAFAGPIAGWGIIGVGLSALLAARAGSRLWLLRLTIRPWPPTHSTR